MGWAGGDLWHLFWIFPGAHDAQVSRNQAWEGGAPEEGGQGKVGKVMAEF